MRSSLRKRDHANLQKAKVICSHGEFLVVKSKRGRRRYVVFEMSVPMTKEELIRALRTRCGGDVPYVIQCVPGKAVIRCSPDEIDKVKDRMRIIDGKSESILTSGTLKTLRDKYPVLKTDTKPRK